MPVIPSTRKKVFRTVDQDKIQYTKHHVKHSPINKQLGKKQPTTLNVANDFVKLLSNSNNESQKIKSIAENITTLYKNVSFSAKQFTDHISQHAINKIRLLECYYKLVSRLEITCLSLYTITEQLSEDQFLELVSYEEDIAEAYIPFLKKELRDTYFKQDGKQLVNFINGPLKRENASCLFYILQYRHEIMKEDQLLMQLLNLRKIECRQESYYQGLYNLKQHVFANTNKRLSDAVLMKIPICELISSWFYEFNAKSTFKFIDFLSHILYLNSTSTAEQSSKVLLLDVFFLLHVYDIGCQKLKREGTDVLRIFDIIDVLNNAVMKALEKDIDTDNELPFLLTLAQITLEHLHSSIGYTYAKWFQTLFIDQQSSTLNSKKAHVIFIKVLQILVPFEVPSILQIHGKAILNSTMPNAPEYISQVKKRLLELGVNYSLKSYPDSLKLPLTSLKETIVIKDDDEIIQNTLEQFKEKKTIPTNLLQSHIFKRQWFYATFLPKLLKWKGPMLKERDELVKALRNNQKIPESLYQEFAGNKRLH